MIVGTLRIPSICVVAWKPGAATVTYATHEVIEGKPKKQFIAEDSRTAVVSLYLHRQLGVDPVAIREALEATMLAREVIAVQEDGGTVLGTFVITSVQPSATWKLADGFVMSERLDVSFDDPGLERELVPAAKPLAVAGTSAGGGPSATTPSGASEDLSKPAGTWTSGEIARR